ncbi:MAG: 50S ribosomal protein L9 [Ruminococcus sp.]|nr:50S ribosomal protein L9 [Ruminococcus sp.]
MKVILIKDVKGSGKAGDTLNVADGYGRNYLIAKGFAVEANAKNLNDLAGKKASAQHKIDVETADNKAVADKIGGKEVVIKTKAGQGGKLFGAVTASAVSDALKAQYGVNVDKKKINLNTEIKAFGDFSAVIKLTHGVSCEIKIKVIEE